MSEMIWIKDSKGVRVPYKMKEREPDLFFIENMYNMRFYWVSLAHRTCDCGNFEFERVDTGMHCKHLRALREWKDSAVAENA